MHRVVIRAVCTARHTPTTGAFRFQNGEHAKTHRTRFDIEIIVRRAAEARVARKRFFRFCILCGFSEKALHVCADGEMLRRGQCSAPGWCVAWRERSGDDKRAPQRGFNIFQIKFSRCIACVARLQIQCPETESEEEGSRKQRAALHGIHGTSHNEVHEGDCQEKYRESNRGLVKTFFKATFRVIHGGIATECLSETRTAVLEKNSGNQQDGNDDLRASENGGCHELYRLAREWQCVKQGKNERCSQQTGERGGEPKAVGELCGNGDNREA
ncbi:MAG: hypothetical protein G01um1014106_177 [Parcubacteria group bacterium Gr01-1014_106]|nr:MAG: hypothetical protein G01um1014106_177 [Parcubacteria group bacterium Gr01-1014_106]